MAVDADTIAARLTGALTGLSRAVTALAGVRIPPAEVAGAP